MPHSTAWRCLYSSGSNAGGRPRRGPASCGGGPGRPSPGWCNRSRAAAGTRGWRGNRTPCPPAPGPAGCGADPARHWLHPDTIHHRLEQRAVTTLPGGDQDRQRLLQLLAGQVRLGGQAAPGAAQGVIGRLGFHPARRLSLRIPLFLAPAACWCALAIVESTLTSQLISPAASARPCRAVRTLRQVPRAATAGTAHTPSAMAHTPPARPSTARRCAPATGYR